MATFEDLIKYLVTRKKDKTFYKMLYNSKLPKEERDKIDILIDYKKWPKRWKRVYLKTAAEDRRFIFVNLCFMMYHCEVMEQWGIWQKNKKFINKEVFNKFFNLEKKNQ